MAKLLSRLSVGDSKSLRHSDRRQCRRLGITVTVAVGVNDDLYDAMVAASRSQIAAVAMAKDCLLRSVDRAKP